MPGGEIDKLSMVMRDQRIDRFELLDDESLRIVTRENCAVDVEIREGKLVLTFLYERDRA